MNVLVFPIIIRASKFAVVGMIESVEQEVRRYGKENIMFSIVCPMFVNTNLLKEKEDRITVSSRCDGIQSCFM